MSDTLSKMFDAQKNFSKNFYDVDALSEQDREQLTIKLTAALHNEASSLLAAINFQTHRSSRKDVSKNNIIHEGVDIWRYLQAIMQVWNVSSDEFLDAFNDRDLFLNFRHELESNQWKNQPVILVDIDDVLSQFRNDFTSWLRTAMNINVDENSEEYYATKDIVSAGYAPDELFMYFIQARQLKSLLPIPDVIKVINELHDRGFWIHLITARPANNLTCKYDTYAWIKHMGIKCHRISFDPEKFLWASRTNYYKENKIICAIDDSSKHAREYSKHGIICCAPKTSYNKDLSEVQDVFMFENASELRQLVLEIATSKK